MKAQILAVFLSAAAAAQAQPQPDRAAPVVSGPAKPFQVPAVQESQLKMGVKLALMQVSRLPLVSVRIVLPQGGSASDPAGKSGLAGLVSSLLTEGAGGLDSRAFAEAIDDLGAAIGVDVSEDAMTVTVFTAKENLDRALGLAASLIRAPALPQAEFDRIKDESLAGLQQEKGSPGALAERRLALRVFGDHPYGRAVDEKSLGAVTLGDVKAFAGSRLGPAGAVIAASGDLDMKELETLAAKHFGSWRAGPGAAAGVAPVTAVAVAAGAAPGLVIDLVDMPGALQSSIRAGHLSIARSDPDYFPVSLMNFLLGRAPILSRLDKNLREAHGWAYGARSSVDALKKGGSLEISADVQTDATAQAVIEILKELRRLRDEPVADVELLPVKRLMAGMFVLKQQTVQAMSAQVAGIELYGLPHDTLSTYRDKVMAVGAADLQAAARKHLRPDALQIVISGDSAKIRKDLEALGVVRVFDIDGNPKAGGAATAPASAGKPGA